MIIKFDKNYYTGIGSRSIPKKFEMIVTRIAEQLAREGWILRSGGAFGTDKAFEDGCDHANGEKEIFLPWSNYNDSKSEYIDIPLEANEIAKKHHPNWKNLPEATQKLMSRNVEQILGHDLNTPSAFVLCWTEDKCENGSATTKATGGTGQALRVANTHNIRIFNLNVPNTVERLFDFLD